MGDINVSGCFHEGTMVSMNNGSFKRIADVTVNERVVAYNKVRQRIEEATVEYVERTPIYRIVKIELANGRTIWCTPEHRFLCNDNEWRSC